MANLVPGKKKQEQDSSMPAPDWHPLARFRKELDTLVERFWNQWPAWSEDLFGRERSWGMDVRDEGNQVVVEADAPGFEAEDFDVRVSSNQLIVKAERKEQGKKEGHSDFRYGHFQRVITLPQGIEPEKVHARYHSGVLEIRLPKDKKAKGKRISVRAD